MIENVYFARLKTDMVPPLFRRLQFRKTPVGHTNPGGAADADKADSNTTKAPNGSLEYRYLIPGVKLVFEAALADAMVSSAKAQYLFPAGEHVTRMLSKIIGQNFPRVDFAAAFDHRESRLYLFGGLTRPNEGEYPAYSLFLCLDLSMLPTQCSSHAR